MKLSGSLKLNGCDQEGKEEASCPRHSAEESGNCFRHTSIDCVTGKTVTWVAAGKEKLRTLSCIVMYCHQPSVCVAMFLVSRQDKPSGLWWVNTTSLVEKVVALDNISKPLVTAKDEGVHSKL